MANILTGKIGIIYPTQTIAAKNGGNSIIKREFVIRALRFNPEDGTPELSKYNTPILEVQGEDKVGILDNFKKGDVVKVYFTVEGRSVKNQDGTFKFFDSIRANRIEKLDVVLDDAPQAPASAPAPAAQVPAASQAQQANNGQQAESQDPLPKPADDLPF